MEFLDQIYNFIVSAQGQANLLSVVAGFLLGLFPSGKFLAFAKLIISIGRGVVKILSAALDLMEKVLPTSPPVIPPQ